MFKRKDWLTSCSNRFSKKKHSLVSYSRKQRRKRRTCPERKNRRRISSRMRRKKAKVRVLRSCHNKMSSQMQAYKLIRSVQKRVD